MPHTKTSLRAEQRTLREKMRGLGLNHRQIAAEFARRYRLRPRAAWRHAYGWSLKEAAERINDYTACTGLDPSGTTVTMTSSHLCEYENWPGPGAKPSGRKPTVYVLSLLANIYQCTVHDLLDLADYEHLPPADRLILDKHTLSGPQALQTAVAQSASVTAASPALPLTVADASGAGPGPGGPELARGATAADGRQVHRSASMTPGEAGVQPRFRRRELPGAHVPQGTPERSLIMAAAHESSEHAGRAEATNVGEATLEQLEADVTRIATEYVHAPPLPMFAEALRVRDRVYRLLEGRQRPADTARLHLLAGILCGLLANASTDLGHRDAAAELARAAWAYGEIIGHNGLRAWTRGMQALIEYWSERPHQAARLAQSGQRYADSATAKARLYSIEARIWARLGNLREATGGMRAADQARELGPGGDYLHDEIGGVFGFDDAKRLCYTGATCIHLGRADPALDAAGRAIDLYEHRPARHRSYGAESLARVDAATAHLLKGSLDGAADTLEPVLTMPAAKRIAQLGQRLSTVGDRLVRPQFSGAREARDLRERISEVCASTGHALPLGSRPADRPAAPP